jgi:hypothetical protein
VSLPDRVLMGSLAMFAVMGLMHDTAGWLFYVKGRGYGPFADDHWKPETIKQRCMLGVFFTASFAWWQSVALMMALLYAGNPLGGWLGVIALAFTLPQFLLALHFIGWDWVAKAIYAIHLLVLTVWTVDAFAR